MAVLRFMKAPRIRLHRRSLVKAAMAFAGLLFFVPQLSSKFYLCANAPVDPFAVRCISHDGNRPADPSGSSLAHERHPSLSLDKRYTVKHVFALLPVSPGLCERCADGPETCTVGTPPAVHPPQSSHRLRGPPSL
ncbi:MAG TPA: hypothetical protein VKQ52_16475 [Puia sp.]|nr:hypothetical protein [Puia sp.]